MKTNGVKSAFESFAKQNKFAISKSHFEGKEYKVAKSGTIFLEEGIRYAIHLNLKHGGRTMISEFLTRREMLRYIITQAKKDILKAKKLYKSLL